MSIVCCKVSKNMIEVASDSISVRGYTQSKGQNIRLAKLTKVNNLIIGSVGLAQESVLMQLFCETHQIKSPDIDSILTFLSEFSDWKKGKIDNSNIDNSYIFVLKGKAFAIGGYLVSEITDYEAIGAGMDYALAAMYLGHGVKDAVKVACELSVYCEEPVIYMVEDI